MKRADINHPWMQEMISRRSGGDADYVAGVRAFLSDATEPLQGTTAHGGYMDAHDMCAHISEIAADLWADVIEEEARSDQHRSFVSRCSAADQDDRGTMSSPGTGGSERSAQETARRREPEENATLNRFIAANPKLFRYYEGLSKDALIRNLMLGEMRQREVAENRDQPIRGWIEEHPEMKERIESRIQNVPPQNRERAFISASETEAMNQTVRQNGNGIRP